MKKTIKKVLALVLAVLMCSSVAIPVVADDVACPGTGATHTKSNCSSYTKISETPSICGENGYTVYECNTCHTYFLDDITLAVGEHEYEKKGAIVNATCTEDGYKVCDICGHKTKTDDKLEHKFGQWELDGKDCDGSTVKEIRKCVNTGCDHFETRDRETEIGDHDWTLVEVIKAPTCSVAGSGTFKCDTCEVTETLVIEPTQKHTFTIYLNAKAETCTEDGNKAGYACAECGAYESESMHIPAAHKYQVSQNEEATCEKAGWVVNYCTVCGDSEATVTAPLGHDRGKVLEYVAPNCISAGYTKYEHVCSRGCDEDDSTSSGYVAGVTVDDETDNVKIAIAATPDIHTYELITHEATCQTEGFTRLECQIEGCGAVDKDSYTKIAEKNPDNHEWKEQILVKPTCTAAGQKTRNCVCGALESAVSVPATGHKYFNEVDGVKTSSKTPTVTMPSCKVGDGYITWQCMNCTDKKAVFKDYVGEWTVGTSKVSLKYDATNTTHHKFDYTMGNKGVLGTEQGDCKTVGYNSYFCKDCAKLVQIPIEGTGKHIPNMETFKSKVEAKCETKGYAEYWQCDRCEEYWEGAEMKDGKYVYEKGSDAPKRIEYKALGHKNYVAGKLPTCTENGYKATWDCDVCGTKSTSADDDYIKSALGHDWIVNPGKAAVVNTDCESYSYTGYVCKRKDCGAEKIDDFKYIDHDWDKDNLIEATCEEGAYYNCKNCTSKNYQGEKLGHLDQNGKVVKCATATFKCYREDCTGVDFETTHNYSVTTVAATCTNVSYKLYQCVDCTYHKKSELGLNKAPHNYHAEAGVADTTVVGDWTVTVEPTYTAPGSRYQKCTVCGDKKVDDNYVKDDIKVSFTTTNPNNDKAAIVNSGLIAVTIKTTSYKLSVWGLSLSLKFDEQVVEFAGYEVNNVAFKDTTKVDSKNVYDDGITIKDYVDRDDVVTIVAFAPNTTDGKTQNVEINGEEVAFVTVYFRVLGTVTNDTPAEFTVTQDTEAVKSVASDDESEEIAVTTGTIPSVTIKALGDVNGDADITAVSIATVKDAMGLMQLIEKNMQNEDKTYNAMADIDKDGVITAHDFGYLMQYISGEITYSELCAIGVNE